MVKFYYFGRRAAMVHHLPLPDPRSHWYEHGQVEGFVEIVNGLPTSERSKSLNIFKPFSR